MVIISPISQFSGCSKIVGINVDIRDGQGRTVLETLAEHENEKASDLTQVIQSREGWSECRKLIEGFLVPCCLDVS